MSTKPAAAQAAWDTLEYSLRQRMRAGELHFNGVLVKPEVRSKPQLISANWPFEIRFDLFADAVTMGGWRFANVTVSKQAPVVAVISPVRPNGRLPPITPENLRDLSDQEVFDLVEEHARRVVARAEVQLFAGRISFMPIIMRKMLHRAEMGETLDTLGAETAE